MTAQDSYLAHIVARIDADVQFLVEQGALSQADAHDISAKLNGSTNATIHGLPPPPARSTGPAASVTSGFSSVAAAFKRTVAPPPAPTPAATPLSMPTPTTPAAPPRSSGPVMLRALWDWDDENDLSFKAGDRIELTEETSPEWWTGRMGARTGLFPSNYVERIEPAVHVNHRASAHMAPSATYKASNLNSYNHSSSSHSATSSIGLTQPAVDEPKKSKYDGLKKTMANSAAGGVGFGAGAAIGGGLVRAIF